jgi:hypothetical protein
MGDTGRERTPAPGFAGLPVALSETRRLARSMRYMRSAARPRRYIARFWLLALRPVLRYSATRDAFVLRLIGNARGPVLRPNRRRRPEPFDGIDRRGVQTA